MADITALEIRKTANKTWIVLVNGIEAAFKGQNLYHGGIDGDFVTIKAFNGAPVVERVPYSIIKYVDTVTPANTRNSFATSKELLAYGIQTGFFVDGSSTGSGGPTSFTELDDTPDSYIGRGGQVLVINESETGVDSEAIPIINVSTDLADFPATVAAGKYLRRSADGLTWEAVDAVEGDQNNIGYSKFFGFIFTPPSITDAVTYFNNRTIVVTDQQTPVIFTITQIASLPSRVYPFLFLPGKGTYGLGGIPINQSMLFPLPVNYLTAADIENDPEANIRNLDPVTDGDFIGKANTIFSDFRESTYPDPGQNFYFSYTDDGVLYYALFVGEPDTYGVGGNQLFVSEDFITTANSNTEPEIPLPSKTSDLENDGEDGSSPYVTEYYLENLETSITSYVNLACVVRLNTTTGLWEIINDSVHKPIYVTSIENLEIPGQSTFNFRLNYPTVDQVGTLLGTVDETYASQGYFVGGSVGASNTNIRITKQGIAVGFNCTSGVWSMIPDSQAIALPSNFSSSFNTSNGNLTITHTALIFSYGDGIILEALNNNYKPEFVSKTTTSFTIRFRDNTGSLVLVANDDMDFLVNRTGLFRVPNANLMSISAAANFWIQGIFHKTGVSGNTPFDYPIDSYPIDNSESLITSGGVYDFVQDQKQNLQQVTDKGATTTTSTTFSGGVVVSSISITGGLTGNLTLGTGAPLSRNTVVRDAIIGADNGSSADLSAGSTTFNNSLWQLRNRLALKQDTLVSGSNIKTVNGLTLLGSGNLVVGDIRQGGNAFAAPFVIGSSDSQTVTIMQAMTPAIVIDNASATHSRTTNNFAGDIKITGAGDVEVTNSSRGVILKSPNGTRYRITVSDTGVLTTTSI